MEILNITAHLNQLKLAVEPAQLIVVSKYRPIEQIKAVHQAGQRHFAENRVQALMERVNDLPKNIYWHLIGHLQSNKVKYIAPFIHTIHSVDSEKLLDAINEAGARADRKIRVLLQVKIAQEETKHGWEIAKLRDFAADFMPEFFTYVEFAGLMAMATNTSDKEVLDKEFTQAQQLFTEMQPIFGPDFKELSLGMSSDYEEAVSHGSTMVRIGSGVFDIFN